MSQCTICFAWMSASAANTSRAAERISAGANQRHAIVECTLRPSRSKTRHCLACQATDARKRTTEAQPDSAFHVGVGRREDFDRDFGVGFAVERAEDLGEPAGRKEGENCEAIREDCADRWVRSEVEFSRADGTESAIFKGMRARGETAARWDESALDELTFFASLLKDSSDGVIPFLALIQETAQTSTRILSAFQDRDGAAPKPAFSVERGISTGRRSCAV
jgi:hypothetical protein